MDGNGGPCYIGTGCFHRRDTLCGLKMYSKESRAEWRSENERRIEETFFFSPKSYKFCISCSFFMTVCLPADGIDIRLPSRGHSHRIVYTIQRLEIYVLQSRKKEFLRNCPYNVIAEPNTT